LQVYEMLSARDPAEHCSLKGVVPTLIGARRLPAIRPLQPAARRLVVLVPAVLLLATPAMAQSPGAGPVIVIETAKGTIEFETYPDEAPKTVAHVVALVKRNFYNGLRVHRVVPGFVVQFGDPQTRDMTKRELWGRGPASGSGRPIGVAEITRKRTHKKGAVAMAHRGVATEADSQIYITLAARPDLDGKYTVFGQVIAGADVPATLAVTDVIRRVSLRD
jgi:cyclophilin family peptidyl-prolyl cis-trans isomerase